MRWFARKTAITRDDDIILDWDEATLDEPGLPSREPALRKLINGATILVVLVLLGASAHWWLGAAAGLWATAFPPPPYTGALIYGVHANSLVAVRATDGHVQWHIDTIDSGTTTIIHDNSTIYIVNPINQQIAAVHAQTGKPIWRVHMDSAYAVRTGWLSGSHLYVAADSVGTATSSSVLAAIDAPTGHILWQSPLSGTAVLAAGFHAARLLLCAAVHDVNTAATTVIMSALDSQTGAIKWQQSAVVATDGGYSCGEAGTLAFIQKFGNTMENTLTLFDEQTGLIQRQFQLLGEIIGVDHSTIYTTTYGPPSVEQEFQAVSLDSGAVLWHLTGAYVPLYTENESGNGVPTILPATDTKGLVGINMQTGTVAWTWENTDVDDATNGTVSAAAYGTGNALYVVGRTSIYALDGTTGKLLWRTPFDIPANADVGVQLAISETTIFVAAYAQFQALRLQTGAILWKQSLLLEDVFI